MLLTPGHSKRLSSRFAAAGATTVTPTSIPFFTFLLIFIILNVQQQYVASESKYFLFLVSLTLYKCILTTHMNGFKNKYIAKTLNFHVNVCMYV